MSTTIPRINITPSREARRMLVALAKRDCVPLARKASELMERALEMEEDFILGEIALERERTTKKWLSHKEVWGTTK